MTKLFTSFLSTIKSIFKTQIDKKDKRFIFFVIFPFLIAITLIISFFDAFLSGYDSFLDDYIYILLSFLHKIVVFLIPNAFFFSFLAKFFYWKPLHKSFSTSRLMFISRGLPGIFYILYSFFGLVFDVEKKYPGLVLLFFCFSIIIAFFCSKFDPTGIHIYFECNDADCWDEGAQYVYRTSAKDAFSLTCTAAVLAHVIKEFIHMLVSWKTTGYEIISFVFPVISLWHIILFFGVFLFLSTMFFIIREKRECYGIQDEN